MTASPTRLEVDTIILDGREFKLVKLPSRATAKEEEPRPRSERPYLERVMTAGPRVQKEIVTRKLSRDKEKRLKDEKGFLFLNHQILEKYRDELAVTEAEIDSEIKRVQLEHSLLEPLPPERVKKANSAFDKLAVKVSQLDLHRQRKVIRDSLQKELNRKIRNKYGLKHLTAKYREMYAEEILVTEAEVTKQLGLLLARAKVLWAEDAS